MMAEWETYNIIRESGNLYPVTSEAFQEKKKQKKTNEKTKENKKKKSVY